MTQQDLTTFEGYAIVEIMGHQKAAGYVTSRYFGGVCVFHVVQQEKPDQEIVLDYDSWLNGERLNKGSRYRVSRPRAETFIAAASLYRLTPCTADQADALQSTVIEVIERTERQALASGAPSEEELLRAAESWDRGRRNQLESDDPLQEL